MKLKMKYIIIPVIVLYLIIFVDFFIPKNYSVEDIEKYLGQYNNIEFNIKNIKNQKKRMENTNRDLILFECSPKNNSSIKFYIFETLSTMLIPFIPTKKYLSDNYESVVLDYLDEKYKKTIEIKDKDNIDDAIQEINIIREKIYNEKINNFGITLHPKKWSDYVCLDINYNYKEKIVCFGSSDKTEDVLIKELDVYNNILN